mgnify:CR=1 FL=1
MIRIAFIVAAVAAPTPSFAQQAPSRAEQLACRSDAQKFCREQIGNPPQMNACLKSNKAKLSESCRSVVEARGG